MPIRPALLALLFAAPAVAGPGVPGPDYFTGTYDRVGRDAAAVPGLVDDHLRIAPDGPNGLRLTGCGGEVGRLVFAPFSEIENLMEGVIDAKPVWCLFHNNGDNYPILTCSGDPANGLRLTLWPADDFATDLVCPG
jgi:hypothetical protein